MKIIFLILSALLINGCANGSYIYTRVGVGITNTNAKWVGKDRTAAHIGIGYMLKINENNFCDFNWTHNSQWDLGPPTHSEKAESWMDYYGADYVYRFY